MKGIKPDPLSLRTRFLLQNRFCFGWVLFSSLVLYMKNYIYHMIVV